MKFRRRSPSPSASVKSFRSVHADFRYGKDERRSSSRARSRSPDRHSSMSERPYKSGRSKRSRSRSPKNGRAGKKDYGAAGARTIPPPSGLYTMREHSGSDSGSSDADEDDKYRGKEYKLLLYPNYEESYIDTVIIIICRIRFRSLQRG